MRGFGPSLYIPLGARRRKIGASRVRCGSGTGAEAGDKLRRCVPKPSHKEPSRNAFLGLLKGPTSGNIAQIRAAELRNAGPTKVEGMCMGYKNRLW